VNFIELASGAIIDKLKTVLDQDVAVTDLGGNVVADSEIKNFGKHLPTTAIALKENKTTSLPKGELEAESTAWAAPLVYDNQVVGCIILKDNGRMTEEQINLARSLAELLIHQVMVLRMLPTTSQVLDKFFFDLFEGQEKDKQKLLEQSRFLDIHYYRVGLDRDRVVIMLNFPGFWQKLLGANIVPQEAEQAKVEHYKQIIQQVFKPYAQSLDDILVTYFSGDNFLILIAADKEGQKSYEKILQNAETIPGLIKNSLNEQSHIAVPNFLPGLDGLMKAYGQAKITLALGQKLYPENEVFLYSEIVVAKLINQIPRSEQQYFTNHYLKGLLKKPQLLKTLAAYFATDLDLKATAQKLNIHKNTLYYRFDNIEKLIGLDPRSFHNAIKIVLALLMYQINEETETKNPNSQVSQTPLFG